MQLVQALRDEPGVGHDAGAARRFGHAALKVDGRIFAMVSQAGGLVVKLPAERVAALVARGLGCRFEVGGGRRMREWFALEPKSEAPWLPLAREALGFVRGTG